uniref:Phosphate-regulating neutral endopeptidase (inferred by orthology to a human protein) n=1 Tax=Strongyloides venezuelensis TaxID=75913 RepID=A0A0K0FDW3_STRVS
MMNPNESQMQLITMQDSTNSGQNSRSSSPFPDSEGPSNLRSPPRVAYKANRPISKHFICWKQRTILEKILFYIILVLTTVFLLFIIIDCISSKGFINHRKLPNDNDFTPTNTNGRGYIHNESKNNNDEINDPNIAVLSSNKSINICITPGCVQAANSLLFSINTSADPCENFFEYACGRWNDEHTIPDGMSQYGTFDYVREQVRSQLKNILENTDKTESKSIGMVKSVYSACMNTTDLQKKKTQPFLKEIKKLGTWPLLFPNGVDGNTSLEELDLTQLLATIRNEYGVEVFFTVYVYADAKDTTKNILSVDQTILSLGRGSRDYYLNNTMFGNHMRAYKNYMTATMKLLVQDFKLNITDEDLIIGEKELLEFETEFAKFIVPSDNRRNNSRMHNERKIYDLPGLFDQVEWERYFSLIMPPEVQNFSKNDTKIIVTEIEYFKNLSDFLKRSDKRIVVNYVMWRMAQVYTKVLDERFEDVKQELNKVMSGQETKPPRWKSCISTVMGYLPLAIGSVYVKEHFQPSDKNEALEMIENLQKSFIQLVKTNEWVTNKTKTIAIDKANAMIKSIGYPDFILDNTKLDKYYDGLNIEDDDGFVDVYMKAIKWTNRRDFLKLKEPFDKNEFDVSPAAVNAFYSPERNSITFPAGILQPPFFSGNFPKAVNYGGIGAVIGHEITHGFDDQGSQYDKNGNLFNWWDTESFNGFQERKKCIIDQYNQFKVPGTNLTVNGKLTIGENIADNGGVKETYLAYKKSIAGLEDKQPRLPGLQHMSNDKIFFLSYAHFWCGHKKDASAVQQVLTDEHSPEIFRVIGVLSNMKEFSDTFNCPKGSQLNPIKKCSVW